MSEWQPIETAPVDGTEIILAIPKITGGYFVHIGWYNANDAFPWRFIDTFSTEPHGCCEDEDEDRTPVNGARYDARMLWQPLPSPPLAIAIEARRAKTGTGLVHESAGAQPIAMKSQDKSS